MEKDFAREIKRTILRLQKNPLGYEVKYKQVRIVLVEVFSFAVHFYVDSDKKVLVIVANLHQSRTPELYKKR